MNILRNEVKIKKTNLIKEVGVFLNKNYRSLMLIMILGLSLFGVAFAADPDALWQTIASLISTWVTRLGGVIMFVGGVMFGLGWKNDDAEQKSRGVSTIVAGGIVIAVSAISGQFFA